MLTQQPEANSEADLLRKLRRRIKREVLVYLSEDVRIVKTPKDCYRMEQLRNGTWRRTRKMNSRINKLILDKL